MNFIERYITAIIIVIAFSSALSGYFFYHQYQINKQTVAYQNSSILVARFDQLSIIPTFAPTTEDVAVSDSVPKVESSTHTDNTKWYSNNNPIFTWTLPSSATDVSYLITDKATSNPGPKSDGVVSTIRFTGVGDGIRYFNIKFKQDGTWGIITHYQFNTDTVSPLDFNVYVVASNSTQPQIYFEAVDLLSGLDHYEVKVGSNTSWVTVPLTSAGKPYAPIFDRSGTQTVYVKAIDKAGNTTTESILLAVPNSSAGAAIGMWTSRIFDGIVNIVSGYSIIIGLVLILVGILVFIFQFLSASTDRLWHHLDSRRNMRGNERKIDDSFNNILNDMKREVKLLTATGRRRPLGPEEKYLKSKLQQYMKGLKNGGR